MEPTDLEPVEALLAHLDGIGSLGLVLVRAGAHSVGICAKRAVIVSATDRHYVQGRTAAGGSSQHRFANRRANQRRAALESAVDDVARVVLPQARGLAGLVLGGDRTALSVVLADQRLRPLTDLPTRTFPDLDEPRRSVLDIAADRSLDVTITVRRAPPLGSDE
jgi:hypothetical protein